MEFEWDTAKAETNLAKHGITFQEATLIFLDPYYIETPDLAENYDEQRWIAIGQSFGIELFVVYTERGVKTRIISARKANAHERATYWNNYFHAES